MEDKTPFLAMEIETFLTHLLSRGLIDEDSYSFLASLTTTKTPTFYILPKTHKEGFSGISIISVCQSPTVALSRYLDFYLKPIVKMIQSYIKDTNYLLQTILSLGEQIKPGNILISMDVKSPYTNIPKTLKFNIALKLCKTFTRESYQNYIKSSTLFAKLLF